eukprot:gnl/MRDRNA2_/MRDRNA2_83119_c0_seq1.p1 gnl/MRDRNA2_/MRDRNA2_83119_c0~~gnl/MRDRNA2_/MRDRNA2_83119_c0_seq1.p1  ORF type:complete len:292 (+),score=-10.26 gnl/MRDRNA2_/MRDRNA2_83119_c0_seq1:161-1036(+)
MDGYSSYYGVELFQYIRQIEVCNCSIKTFQTHISYLSDQIYLKPKKHYLESNQYFLNKELRCTLINWMVEVVQEFKLQTETLFLAISYVDRYLSHIKNKNLFRSRLQLVGVSAIFLAAKFEEIRPPNISKIIFIADYTYTKPEVLAMEWRIFNVLEFRLIQPTPLTFLYRFFVGNKFHSLIERVLNGCLCMYLCELSMCDYEVATTFLPSLIASSSILLANVIFAILPRWGQNLQALTGGYRSSDLKECCNLMFIRLKLNMVKEVFFRPERLQYSKSIQALVSFALQNMIV